MTYHFLPVKELEWEDAFQQPVVPLYLRTDYGKQQLE